MIGDMREMQGFAYLLLGLLAFAGLLLFWGGLDRMRKGDRQKAMLMVAAGAVMLGNVLIWVV
jgi:hypothetical protein